MRTYLIESSAITAANWDPARGTLELTFESGDVYRSKGPVEGGLVARLMFSSSPGRYFANYLKGQGFDRVRDHRPVVSPADVAPCPDCTRLTRHACPTCLGLGHVPAPKPTPAL